MKCQLTPFPPLLHAEPMKEDFSSSLGETAIEAKGTCPFEVGRCFFSAEDSTTGMALPFPVATPLPSRPSPALPQLPFPSFFLLEKREPRNEVAVVFCEKKKRSTVKTA